MRVTLLVFAMLAACKSLHGQAMPLYDYRGNQERRTGFVVRKDLMYGVGAVQSGRAAKDLLVDAFLPTGIDGFRKAAIIFIHGGSFIAGDKSNQHEEARFFAEKGFVTFSIDYRKRGDKPIYSMDRRGTRVPYARAAYVDAKTALRWVHSQAQAFGVDPANIFLAGRSAGAVAALAIGVTGEATYSSDLPGQPVPPSNSPGASTAVRGIIDFCGGIYGIVDSIDAGDPPILIYHGTRDRTVPFSRALALRDRCREVELACEFHPVRGGGHCPSKPAANGKSLRQLTHEFILKHLKS